MKWRTIPFVRLLSSLLLGISLAISLDYPLAVFLTELVLILAYSLWVIMSLFKIPYTLRWIPGIYLSLLLILTAYHLTIQNNQQQSPAFFAKHHPKFLFGKILSVKEKANSQQVQIQIKSIQDSCKNWYNTSGKLIAYFPKQTSFQKGDQIVFQSKLNELPKGLNPNAFNYRRYLFFQSIYHQTYISASNFLVVQPSTISIPHRIWQWQQNCIAIFQQYIPYPHAQGIATSLVLGYRDTLDPSVRDAYTNTGSIHVLAVSGLHVGLLCLIIQFFLKKVSFSSVIWKWTKLLITIIIIWIYVFFTGASASVLRAGLMFSLILLGNGLNESSNIYNTLAASAFCLLLFQPYLLFNVGFQLSYSAVLGIVYFHPKLYSLLYFQNKVADYCWNLSCVSIAAQITTLPISLYYFHQFPIYFWLSGLIVVPAAGLILGIGLLLIMVSSIPSLAQISGQILGELIHLMNECIFYLAHLPFSTIIGIYWSWWMVFIYFLALLAMVYFIESKSNHWILVFLLLFTTICANWARHSITHQDQKLITIYGSNKQTLIECFDGSTSFAIKSSGLSPKSFDYATKNYYTSKNIQKTIHLAIDTSFQKDHFFMNNGLIQFYDKKGLIIHPEIDWEAIPTIHYDFAIVVDNPFIPFQQLKNKFNIPLLIFDLSNTKRKIKIYKAESTKHEIPFHDIRAQGAWILDLKN